MTILLIRADFAKSFIAGHTRKLASGKVVPVAAYSDKRSRKMEVVHDDRTADLFLPPKSTKPVTPIPDECARHPEKCTPDLFTGKVKSRDKPKTVDEANDRIATQQMGSELRDGIRDEIEQGKRAQAVGAWRSKFKPGAENTASGDIAHSDHEKLAQLIDGGQISEARAHAMIDSAVAAGILDSKTGEYIKSKATKQPTAPVDSAQADSKDVAHKPKEHRYAMVNRPVGIGTSPGGELRVEARPDSGKDHHDYARNGVAVYDHKLTDAQTKQFEMAHMADGDDRNEYADAVIDKFGEYAPQYLEMATKKPERFAQEVAKFLKLAAIGHHPSVGDAAKFAELVKDRLNQKLSKEMTKSMQPRILLLKSHVKQYTDKNGRMVKEHDDKRVKKMQAVNPGRAAKQQDPAGGAATPGTNEPAKPQARDPEDVRGSAHGYGTHNVEEGDTLKFKAGEFEGAGTVKSAGKDGAVVTDESGRDHNVHWHEVAGFNRGNAGKPAGDGGGDKPPADTARPVDDAPEPEKKNEAKPSTVLGKQEPIPAESFSAADYAKSHDQADVSAESILTGFPPDTKEKIKAVVERLAGIEQTIDKMKHDPAYLATRTILHAKIKSELLSPARVKAATPEAGQKPTFVILGGRGGSGKSALTEPTSEGGLGLVDKNKFILLDADEIKGMLPEYEGWNAAQVHEESGELFDEITRLATDLGLNICHDATMKTPKKAVALVDQFNAAGYQTEAHYMHLPRQEAAKRAVSRFLGKTGRYVPAEVILGNTQNESAFDSVKAKVGKWTFHDNNVPKDTPPILISRSSEDKPMTKAVASPIILLWRRK